MAQATCAGCGRLFTIRPQSPTQTFCSEAECQRRRPQAWNKHKLSTDPDYRANQRAAERAWHARNPDYWPSYRLRRKDRHASDSSQGSRATSDASFCGVGASAGLCWIEIQTPGATGQAQTWRVELTLKPPFATDSACFVFANDAPGRLEPHVVWAAKRISEFLKVRGSATRRDLVVDCFGRHQSAAVVDAAIAHLICGTERKIHVETRPRSRSGPGRAATIYRLVKS